MISVDLMLTPYIYTETIKAWENKKNNFLWTLTIRFNQEFRIMLPSYGNPDYQPTVEEVKACVEQLKHPNLVFCAKDLMRT